MLLKMKTMPFVMSKKPCINSSKRDCSRGRRWKCTITVLREDGPIQVVAYASKLKNAKAAAAKAILRKIKED